MNVEESQYKDNKNKNEGEIQESSPNMTLDENKISLSQYRRGEGDRHIRDKSRRMGCKFYNSLIDHESILKEPSKLFGGRKYLNIHKQSKEKLAANRYMRSGGDQKRVVNIGEELGLIYDDNYVLPSITNNEGSIPFLRRRKKRQKSSMQDSSTLSLSATKPASPRSFDICNSIQFGLFNTNIGRKEGLMEIKKNKRNHYEEDVGYKSPQRKSPSYLFRNKSCIRQRSNYNKYRRKGKNICLTGWKIQGEFNKDIPERTVYMDRSDNGESEDVGNKYNEQEEYKEYIPKLSNQNIRRRMNVTKSPRYSTSNILGSLKSPYTESTQEEGIRSGDYIRERGIWISSSQGEYSNYRRPKSEYEKEYNNRSGVLDSREVDSPRRVVNVVIPNTLPEEEVSTRRKSMHVADPMDNNHYNYNNNISSERKGKRSSSLKRRQELDGMEESSVPMHSYLKRNSKQHKLIPSIPAPYFKGMPTNINLLNDLRSHSTHKCRHFRLGIKLDTKIKPHAYRSSYLGNISNVPNKSINKNSMSMSMSQDKDKDISYTMTKDAGMKKCRSNYASSTNKNVDFISSSFDKSNLKIISSVISGEIIKGGLSSLGIDGKSKDRDGSSILHPYPQNTSSISRKGNAGFKRNIANYKPRQHTQQTSIDIAPFSRHKSKVEMDGIDSPNMKNSKDLEVMLLGGKHRISVEGNINILKLTNLQQQYLGCGKKWWKTLGEDTKVITTKDEMSPCLLEDTGNQMTCNVGI